MNRHSHRSDCEPVSASAVASEVVERFATLRVTAKPPDAASGPIDEGRSEVRLELLDLTRDGGDRDPERVCGLCARE